PQGIMTFRDLFHIALEQGNSDSVLDNSDQAISVIFTRKGFLSNSGFGNTIQAKDVMTNSFESVDFEEDLIVACEEMVQNRINGVGVRINGKLGGVVSKTDILKAIYIDNDST
ncbi:MAG: CBS domain-containing protein, partial [Nitrosopumilus sp.]|nr:CBS domain-containing protein [Nitrosopumilus sp.]